MNKKHIPSPFFFLSKSLTSKLFASVFILTLFFVSVPQTATAQRKKKHIVSKAESDSLSLLATRKNTALFSDGLRERLTGNDAKAIENFEAALLILPTDDGSMYELSDLYARKGRYDESLALMQKATDLKPNNEWYRVRKAQLFKVKGDYKAYAEEFRLLLKLKPDNIDYYGELSSALMALEKYDEALDIFNEIENQIGVNEPLSFQKHNIYLALDKPDKAIKEIEKLSAVFPYETRYLTMLHDLYKKNGQPEKALEMLQKSAEINPNDPYTHISLAEYYRDQGKEDQAFESLLKAFEGTELDVDNKIQIMLLWFDGQSYSDEVNLKVERIAAVLLKANPESARGYQIYADVFMREQKYDQARTNILKSFNFDKNNYQMWETLLYADIQLQDFASLNQHATETNALFPEQPLPYLFNGIALFQLKKYPEALAAFETGRKFVVRNDKLLAEFYSNIGDTQHRLKNTAASDVAYTKSLSIQPDNALVLNNYAYYLSLRGEDLDKAHQMAQKALELQPDNASYLDTFAWILFQQKDFYQALIWIEKAIEKTEQVNGTLLEHYGDILFHLDRADEAVQQWQKAAAAGETSALIQKKINDKKYYE